MKQGKRLFVKIIARARWALAFCFLAAFAADNLHAQSVGDVAADSALQARAMFWDGARAAFERDMETGFADAGMYFTAPLRFSARDWGIALGTLGVCAALLPTADESARAFAQNSFPRTDFTDGAATLGRLYGELWLGAGLGAGLYAVGLAAADEHTRVTGRIVIESLAFSGVVTLALKSLAGRSRPFTEDGAHTFAPVQIADERTAFPSGHATVAFAVSAVLSERVGNPWIGAGLYALASLTALSRVYHDKHWVSDVVLGGAIGAGAGLLAAHFERERSEKASDATTAHRSQADAPFARDAFFIRQITFIPMPTGIGVIGVFR